MAQPGRSRYCEAAWKSSACATDRAIAEKILIEVAEEHTKATQLEAEPHRKRLIDHYHMEIDPSPRVFYRITDDDRRRSVSALKRASSR